MKDCAPTFYAIPGFIKQKNCVLHEFGNKMQLGVWGAL